MDNTTPQSDDIIKKISEKVPPRLLILLFVALAGLVVLLYILSTTPRTVPQAAEPVQLTKQEQLNELRAAMSSQQTDENVSTPELEVLRSDMVEQSDEVEVVKDDAALNELRQSMSVQN